MTAAASKCERDELLQGKLVVFCFDIMYPYFLLMDARIFGRQTNKQIASSYYVAASTFAKGNIYSCLEAQKDSQQQQQQQQLL